MNDNELCPFSKPIFAQWCQCQYAILAERCSGKMSCTRTNDLKESCQELDEAFKLNTRFILGLKNDKAELTHAHLMKIRCGGLLGMQRVLNIEIFANVRKIIDETTKIYGSIDQFPFNQIVQDIKSFKYRK